MKVKAEKAKSKKQLAKIVFAIFFVLLVGYCSFNLISNTASISRLNSKSEQLQAKYEQQLSDNDKLKAILNSDNQDEYIEQKAREKGYVKSGEVVYFDISSSK